MSTLKRGSFERVNSIGMTFRAKLETGSRTAVISNIGVLAAPGSSKELYSTNVSSRIEMKSEEFEKLTELRREGLDEIDDS